MHKMSKQDFLEFNYHAMIIAYQNRINIIREDLDATTTELNGLQSATDPTYSEILKNIISILQNKIDSLNSLSLRFTEIIDEINAILNLPQEVKDNLYYFYTVIGNSNKEDFMSRILFNYQDILRDPVILALIEDTKTSLEVKKVIAKLCYDKYQRKSEVMLL